MPKRAIVIFLLIPPARKIEGKAGFLLELRWEESDLRPEAQETKWL
jgi:hypothetical protein